ncbi:LOW QUALITY PROTEIN: cryptochrome DASH [Lycodopsis pacificus]
MSTSGTVICLLRNDLRLHDNELLESIRNLRNTMLNKGSNLVVRRSKPEEVVADLIKQLGSVQELLLHALMFQVTSEELHVEKRVKDVCAQMKVKVHTCWGSTLYHRDDLPFHNMSSLKADPRSAFPCSGGESQALARLKHYFWDTDAVATYKETRNGLIGADYSTKFAPWPAMGSLSPRYIYHQIQQYERERTANQSTYWVIFLLWRDYFKFVGVKYGNRLFQIKGRQDKSVPWLFNAWKEGRTGVPFVDANMRELAMTGLMSNRGRQNVARFLTKDLGLDWRMGAELNTFWSIDHDVCSNYGNWLYSAGIGNDPRENRKFNMIKQGLDYDNNGDYVRQWVPELQGIRGADVHAPWTLSTVSLSHAHVTLGETYPTPIVMTPEWSRHVNKKPSGTGPSPRGKKGPSHTSKQHQDRGIDFYFSRSKKL